MTDLNTPKKIHDAMQDALDRQLIQALDQDAPASAAIITAGIKRLEQLGKELATDPSDELTDTIKRLKDEDRIINEVDLHDDDPATNDRY